MKIPDVFCDFELHPYPGISDELGWLSCTLEVDHDGDHETLVNLPCMNCGGIELHYDGCEDMEETASGSEVMVLGMDKEGWYWVKRLVH